jgi:hypothetical protein
MGFTSKLYPNEPIWDESTPDRVTHASEFGRGLRLDLRSTPFGDIPCAPAFPQELLIPESDVEGWIKEKEERQNRISDHCNKFGLPHKDQAQTNYCWINAPVHCVEIIRLLQHQQMVILSPASCGAKIKGFRNQGGWGQEGLEYIVENGVVPVSMWPANAIDRQYDKPEFWAEAKKYRVTEWMECRPRSWIELVSCLLRNIPVAVGYNWWSHEVTACDVVWIDGTSELRIRNSWKGWGENGFGILRGSKKLADDQVAPRVAMAA